MSLSPPDASQGSAAKTLIKFIRTSWPIALCSVKLTMSNVLILKNETVVVTCAVSTGPIESRPPMLLNQTLNDLIRDRLVSQKHQWLSEVTISFLSLVVCVRKRNGSLRLRRLFVSCTRGQYLTAIIFLVFTQLLRVLGAMNGCHFWNKEKPITRKGFLYMELKWKQDLQCKLLTREVNYMKRIVSTNGYRKEKSITQVVLAL